MSKTNITPAHQEAFDALRNPEYDNFALLSAFVNGQPTSIIVAVYGLNDFNEEGKSLITMQPLFVAVTPDMVLTDHFGERPVTGDDLERN